MNIPEYFLEYYCVFVCEPKLNSPYALYATKGQAKIFRKSVESCYPIMKFKKWLTMDYNKCE
jgi:hypothetical protein